MGLLFVRNVEFSKSILLLCPVNIFQVFDVIPELRKDPKSGFFKFLFTFALVLVESNMSIEEYEGS